LHLLIASDGGLSLQDTDNMRVFSIVEEPGGVAATALGDIAEAAEDNHFWIDADAVVELSGRGEDQNWVSEFWEMLAKVEAYGYSDIAMRRVKAHLDQA
jgi:hypothetical protein